MWESITSSPSQYGRSRPVGLDTSGSDPGERRSMSNCGTGMTSVTLPTVITIVSSLKNTLLKRGSRTPAPMTSEVSASSTSADGITSSPSKSKANEFLL